MSNEVYLTLLGFRIGKYYFAWGCFRSEGTPVSVEGNIEKIRKWRKYLIGFYHTHPNMPNYYSNTDLNTMLQLSRVYGKNLFCIINGIEPCSTLRPKNITNANYRTYTYPMEDIEDYLEFCGYAFKLGRFFCWRD